MRASVIVPARDAESTLARTLDCLARQEYDGDYEVVVVDAGSVDRTPEIAEAAAGPVKLVRADALDAAGARNLGAAEASGAVLAFTDADCFPEPGWLAAGTRALDGHDLVQGHVLPDPDMPPGPFDRTLWVTRETGLWESANLFVTREAFARVGGFENWLEVDLGKMMAEDVWFGWSVRRAGGRSCFSAEALAYHAVFPRGPVGYLEERRRVRYFPAIASKAPEVRETLFFKRLFLSRRSAAFDGSVAALAAAALLRSKWPLLALVPYALVAWRERLRHQGRRRMGLIAAVDAVADALTLAELLRGSVSSRSLVL